MMRTVETFADSASQSAGKAKSLEFPALRNPRYPVHQIADQLEPYLRLIVEKFHPEKIILFGSQAYGQPDEHSDVDLLIVRKGVVSTKKGNLEIRRAFDEIPGSRLPFTLLSKSPETLQLHLQEGHPFYEEIVNKGLELYAAA